MSEVSRTSGFRFAPPAEFEDELVKLTIPLPGREYALFENRQKVMMFAAALGKYRGRRQAEPFKRGSAIRLEVFQTALDDRFVDALAVAEEKDLSLLASDRAADRIRIFEEYAFSGLKEIVDVCLHTHGDELAALTRLVEDVRAKNSTGFAAIDPDVLRSLGAS